MKLEDCKIGQKVCWYTYKRNIGEIVSISHEFHNLSIRDVQGYFYTVHPKALRRLVKKQKPEPKKLKAWMSGAGVLYLGDHNVWEEHKQVKLSADGVTWELI